MDGYDGELWTLPWQYSLCAVDIPALLLALGACHDVLVPVQQPVAPVAVLVDADISLVQ